MVKSKVVSCALTEKEYEELSMLLAKRIVDGKGYVSMSAYVGEIVREHLTKDNNVSSPALDTDSKQKNNSEWKTFTLDD